MSSHVSMVRKLMLLRGSSSASKATITTGNLWNGLKQHQPRRQRFTLQSTPISATTTSRQYHAVASLATNATFAGERHQLFQRPVLSSPFMMFPPPSVSLLQSKRYYYGFPSKVRTTLNAAQASVPRQEQQEQQQTPQLLQQLQAQWNELITFLQSSNKLPKGLEDFFPPKHSKIPPPEGTELPTESSSSETNKDAASKSTSSEETKLAAKGDGGGGGGGDEDPEKENKKKQQEKQQQQQQKKSSNDSSSSENPMPNNNSLAWLAVLAFLLICQSILEKETEGDGQEITFVDFRNHFLSRPGAVERIQVINHKKARVFLRPEASHALMDGTPGLLAGGGGAGGFQDDTNTMSFDGAGADGSSSSFESQSTLQVRGQPKNYFFYIGSVESFEDKLAKAQSHLHPEEWVEIQYMNQTNNMLEFIKVLPQLALFGILMYSLSGLMGGLGGGAGGGGGPMGRIFSVGRSNAKKIKSEDVHVTFNDVAGCQQAKMEIMEFVDFLKDSDRFTKLGAKIPKGALLCGPPGTGKTLLAKAVAGEAGVPFYSISGSDFIEMFVGVGPSRVRDLFREARANAPCIIFIDEIDAVGRARNRGGFSGGGNDERENTLNQLLVEMDGFSPTTGIVVIAGTNRVDILDQALTRPGRFDRQITVDRPDLQGRKEIFEVHLKALTLKGTIDDYAARLAGLTPGFAGADIANICNEAAIVAARRKGESVTMKDFETATDRIIGGLESNKIMSSEERSIVAHHEAGHAVAGWFLEHADPLLKVTIIPRASGALGFAQYLPKEVFLRNQAQIMDIVCMALAGRAAEEVFFGRVTTGASDDLRRVTQLVYGMIKVYGMNSRLGQLVFPGDGNEKMGEKPYSEETAEAMDEEARAMVDAAYARTVELIREKKADVEKLANLLLEKETITHDDIYDIIGPRPFQSDSAYHEFVTSRNENREKDKAEEEPSSDAEKGNDDSLGGLTPGLAFKLDDPTRIW